MSIFSRIGQWFSRTFGIGGDSEPVAYSSPPEDEGFDTGESEGDITIVGSYRRGDPNFHPYTGDLPSYTKGFGARVIVSWKQGDVTVYRTVLTPVRDEDQLIDLVIHNTMLVSPS